MPAKLLSLSVVAILALATGTAHAQSCAPLPAATEDYKGFNGRIFKDEASGKTLPYRLFKPANYDPKKAYPMVLYLHHAGLAGTDNCTQLTQEIGSGGYGGVFRNSAQAKYPHFIVAPHAPTSNFGWGGGMEGSFAKGPHATHPLIYGILASVRGEFNIDPRRVYVTGISMGCFGTWDLIMRNPTYFAAASAQSCGGDPAGLPQIVKVPMWDFCGSNDQLFAKQSDKMAAAFKALNPVDFTYTVLPGVGHSVINRGYDWVGPPSLIDWLFAQTNKSVPAPDGGATAVDAGPLAPQDAARDVARVEPADAAPVPKADGQAPAPLTPPVAISPPSPIRSPQDAGAAADPTGPIENPTKPSAKEDGGVFSCSLGATQPTPTPIFIALLVLGFGLHLRSWRRSTRSQKT